jgi:putative component of membrane protein insertase Oxa1/YidC/SpoIIIJ protein YidD
MSAASAAAIHGIGFYQRFISPYKGFRCAHHARLGGMSCSSYGKAALREFGLFEGLSKLRARLTACAEAAQPIEADPDEGPKPMSEEERKACAQFAGCTCGNFLPIFFLG